MACLALRGAQAAVSAFPPALQVSDPLLQALALGLGALQALQLHVQLAHLAVHPHQLILQTPDHGLLQNELRLQHRQLYQFSRELGLACLVHYRDLFLHLLRQSGSKLSHPVVSPSPIHMMTPHEKASLMV